MVKVDEWSHFAILSVNLTPEQYGHFAMNLIWHCEIEIVLTGGYLGSL